MYGVLGWPLHHKRSLHGIQEMSLNIKISITFFIKSKPECIELFRVCATVLARKLFLYTVIETMETL